MRGNEYDRHLVVIVCTWGCSQRLNCRASTAPYRRHESRGHQVCAWPDAWRAKRT